MILFSFSAKQKCTRVYAGHSSSDLPIALQCLDALIGRRRRQVPMSRVFAFVKRLSTLSLQMDCHGSLALLALVSNIMSVSLVISFFYRTCYIYNTIICTVIFVRMCTVKFYSTVNSASRFVEASDHCGIVAKFAAIVIALITKALVNGHTAYSL